jgi:putative Holliday junction resolvase
MPPVNRILACWPPALSERRPEKALSSSVMRWLALDIGSRRVGIAVCDAGEGVITPLPSVRFTGAAALARAVARLATEREIGGVVVGVPKTLAGTSRGEQRVSAVVGELRTAIRLPVELVDERGTTAEARARLAAVGVPPRRWNEIVDGVAAQIILETHLGARTRTTSPRTVDPTDDRC